MKLEINGPPGTAMELDGALGRESRFRELKDEGVRLEAVTDTGGGNERIFLGRGFDLWSCEISGSKSSQL